MWIYRVLPTKNKYISHMTPLGSMWRTMVVLLTHLLYCTSQSLTLSSPLLTWVIINSSQPPCQWHRSIILWHAWKLRHKILFGSRLGVQRHKLYLDTPPITFIFLSQPRTYTALHAGSSDLAYTQNHYLNNHHNNDKIQPLPQQDIIPSYIQDTH